MLVLIVLTRGHALQDLGFEVQLPAAAAKSVAALELREAVGRRPLRGANIAVEERGGGRGHGVLRGGSGGKLSGDGFGGLGHRPEIPM